jgi:hypothetical protein
VLLGILSKNEAIKAVGERHLAIEKSHELLQLFLILPRLRSARP